MSARSINRDIYHGKYADEIAIKRSLPETSPVRRNRLQFLSDSNDGVSIDNLPWEGDDSLL